MLFLRLTANTLNFSLFIARKIQKAQNIKGSIISPVIAAATLAISLGMVLMIVSIATGIGLKKAISNKIVGFSGHITISRYDLNNSFENAPIELDSALNDDVLSLNGVAQIQPIATKAGILKGAEDFEGVVLKGVDENYNASFFELSILEGHWPKISVDERSDSILISNVLAKRLKLQLNQEAVMYFIQEPPRPPRLRKFYVAGIFATGLEEYDKTYIIGDLKQVQKLNGWATGEVGGYEILLTSDEKLDDATAEVRNALPYDLDAQSVKTKNEQLYQWLDLFDLNIYLILWIMVAVAIINMVSALLILILDRTNMIGLLKALGASNWRVVKIFLYQSLGIILKGLFWGNLVGIGFCWAQEKFGFIKLDPETYYVTEAPIAFEPLLILALNIGVVAICLVALLIPALMVSRISPVRALRYE